MKKKIGFREDKLSLKRLQKVIGISSTGLMSIGLQAKLWEKRHPKAQKIIKKIKL